MKSKATLHVLMLSSAVIMLRSVIHFILITGIRFRVITSLAVLFITYAFYETHWKRRSLPPGPLPWLIFGNLPLTFFYDSIDDMFLALKQKYGDVVTFWIGPIPLIMVCEIDRMKKYFVKNAAIFSNRWKNYITDTFMDGANGIVQVDGSKWREQRRFALSVLRDYGVSRPIIEAEIHSQIDSLLNNLQMKNGEEVDICEMIGICVGSVISTILFGCPFIQNDGKRKVLEIQCLLAKQFQLVLNPIMSLYIVLPLATKIPILNQKWNELIEIKKSLYCHINAELQEHKRKFTVGTKPTDFIESYLMEMHRREIINDLGYFSEQQLEKVLLDLLSAGLDTTYTTLKWALLYILINPKILNKVREELDLCPVKIELSHRNSCPYTCATINEVQRLANILTINLPRTTAEDAAIDGYFIPRNTLCVPQISVIMNDPINFENPREFQPERFLCDDAKTLKKFEAFIPFSLGKRQCVGESLAKAELFLIFTNILRNFDLKLAKTPTNPMKRVLGLTVSPEKYSCVVQLRSVS